MIQLGDNAQGSLYVMYIKFDIPLGEEFVQGAVSGEFSGRAGHYAFVTVHQPDGIGYLKRHLQVMR